MSHFPSSHEAPDLSVRYRGPQRRSVALWIVAGVMATLVPASAGSIATPTPAGPAATSEPPGRIAAQATDAKPDAATAPERRTVAPVERPERPEPRLTAPATSAEGGDPPSDRAAAAAARARRALAEEQSGEFEGSEPVQTELIGGDEPAATVGQRVKPEQRRQAVTCIAGC